MVVVAGEEHRAGVDAVREQDVGGEGPLQGVVFHDVAEGQPVGDLVGRERAQDLHVEHERLGPRVVQAAGDEGQVGAEAARRTQVGEHRGVERLAEERVVAVADLVAPVDEPPEGDAAAGAGAPADERGRLGEVDAAVALDVAVHVGHGDDAVGQRGADSRARLLVLEDAPEVVDPAVAGEGPPVDHEVVGPPPPGRVGPGAARVEALDPPGVGAEIGVDGVERRAVAQVAPLAVVGDVGGRPGPFGPLVVPVHRLRVEHRQRRRAAQAEPAVHGRDPAVGVEELPARRHHPHGRFRVQIVPGAPREHLGPLAVRAVGGVVPPARLLVVGDEHPEGRVADLAGQLAAVARVGDGAGVQQVDLPRHREHFLAFEEEGAQLGEEEGEPLVDLDLRAVRLDLREVGVVGEVGGQVRGHPVLHVHRALGLRLLVERPRRLVQRPEPDRGHRRQDLQVAARRQAGEPVEQAHLGQEAGLPARDRGPHVRFVLAEDGVHDPDGVRAAHRQTVPRRSGAAGVVAGAAQQLRQHRHARGRRGGEAAGRLVDAQRRRRRAGQQRRAHGGRAGRDGGRLGDRHRRSEARDGAGRGARIGGHDPDHVRTRRAFRGGPRPRRLASAPPGAAGAGRPERQRGGQRGGRRPHHPAHDNRGSRRREPPARRFAASRRAGALHDGLPPANRRRAAPLRRRAPTLV